jgi:hypothetical protein
MGRPRREDRTLAHEWKMAARYPAPTTASMGKFDAGVVENFPPPFSP